MIKSFKHRGLKRLYEQGDESRIRTEYRKKVRSILAVLEAADEIEGMDVATFHLHPLKGDMADFWSVTVRANWRIIFRFEDGNAFDVDLVDYH